MEENRPLYHVAAVGLDPRDVRLIEIVFRHCRYNRFEYALDALIDPDLIDILIINPADPDGLHAVTAVLRSHGVNIENLETDTGAAPWTGAPMFRMKAHLVAGVGVSIPRLREELAKLQERHDLDISLKPVFPLPEGE